MVHDMIAVMLSNEKLKPKVTVTKTKSYTLFHYKTSIRAKPSTKCN